MIGLKNCTPKEFEELYFKYHIKSDINLNIPTFFFSLILEEKVIGYVKLSFKDEFYHLEEIKYDEGMEKFNRFFLKCIAYKIFLKGNKSFYSRVNFEGVEGVEFNGEYYTCNIDRILEQGKCCNDK